MSPTRTPKPPQDAALAEFGARMRARRTELGLSQEAAARHTGIHWTNYARVERGQQSPRVQLVLKIARGLDTTPGALMDGLPLGDDETD